MIPGTGRRGQAAVEMALVLPFFLLLLFAVAETALMYNAKLLVELSAFRAARSLLSTGEPEKAKQSALETLSALDPGAQGRSIAYVKTGSQPQGAAAAVVYLYKPFFPLRPLAKSLGYLLFSEKASGLLEEALRLNPDPGWRGLLERRVAVAASVELLR